MKKLTATHLITNTEATSTKGYSLGRASILDIPLIFDLMMNGSESGAFTERHMIGTGGFKLFLFILLGVLGFEKYQNEKNFKSKWMIVSKAKSQIGFINFKTIEVSEGNTKKLLALYAISPSHRNNGHGKAILKLLIQNQPDNTTIVVYCTKYARAMQHILKKLKFQRNPKLGNPVEEYSFTKNQISRLPPC